MSRSVGPRLGLWSRPFLWLAQFDWFVLYVVTAAVLFFAFYPLLFFATSPDRWSLGSTRSIPLGDALTIILSLEAFLLIWLWLEMPRRRKAETALKKMHSVQRAISRASGRIVCWKSIKYPGFSNAGMEHLMRSCRHRKSAKKYRLPLNLR